MTDMATVLFEKGRPMSAEAVMAAEEAAGRAAFLCGPNGAMVMAEIARRLRGEAAPA